MFSETAVHHVYVLYSPRQKRIYIKKSLIIITGVLLQQWMTIAMHYCWISCTLNWFTSE